MVMMATIEIGNNALLGGVALLVLALIGGLIVFHFNVRRYIRDAVGMRETQQVELTGQPLSTFQAKEYVDKPSFYKHAELNRKAHEDMSTHTKAEMQRLEARMDARMVGLEAKIDGVPSRVIALLKDTKGLL